MQKYKKIIVTNNCTHLLLGVSLAYSGLLPAGAFVLFTVIIVIGGIAASIFNASLYLFVLELMKLGDKRGGF